MDEIADNPDVEPVEVAEPQEEVDAELSLDEAGNPVEQEEEDGEDIEHEGKQYKIPKALKPLLLMQSDYTKKTQEVAAQRQENEQRIAEAQQEIQLQAHTIQARAVLANVDQQLQQYQQVDWRSLENADPAQAASLFRQYQQLKEYRGQVEGTIEQAKAEALKLQRASHEKQIQEGHGVLQREIIGWGPELANNLATFGKSLGYTDKELGQINDPRAVKVLHRLMLLEQTFAKQAKPKPAAEQAKPVTVVKAKSAGAAPTNPAKMSDAQFNAMRRRQIAARNK